MAQAIHTTCAHNAQGQVLVRGRPTTCRKCGAQIEATPRTIDLVSGNTVPSQNQVNAAYPGDVNSTDLAWVFAQ